VSSQVGAVERHAEQRKQPPMQRRGVVEVGERRLAKTGQVEHALLALEFPLASRVKAAAAARSPP
jgi:hypothetical protein